MQSKMQERGYAKKDMCETRCRRGYTKQDTHERVCRGRCMRRYAREDMHERICTRGYAREDMQERICRRGYARQYMHQRICLLLEACGSACRQLRQQRRTLLPKESSVRIFMQCVGGINRSAAAVCAWFILAHNMSAEESIACLLRARPALFPWSHRDYAL